MTWPPTFVAATKPTASDLNDLIAPPSCKAYDATGLTCTSGTAKLVTLDTEVWDYATSAMHSTSTNTARITAPYTGIYLITAQVMFASDGASPTGYRSLYVYKNNAGDTTLATGSHLASRKDPGAIASATHPITLTFHTLLTAGDYVEMYAVHLKGSNLSLTAGAGNTALTVTGIART